MSIHAVHVVDIDTCVTVTSPATKGDVVNYHTADGTAAEVVCNGDIPIYHKVSIAAVKAGEPVIKYGGKIGIATEDIAVGDYVHIHNMRPVGFIED